MDRDDIIRMAREAWKEAGESWVVDGWFDGKAGAFERFAALVAAAEREACAKVCEQGSHRSDDMGAIFAAAIRSRDD